VRRHTSLIALCIVLGYPILVQTCAGQESFDFLPPVSYNAGAGATEAVAVADVNRDGIPDIIVADQGGCALCSTDGSVSVLLGTGKGTFQPGVAYDSGGLFAASVAVGDVNGDGKLDIVVANYISATVGVLLGNGDGTFKRVVAYATGGDQNYSVALADVNNDHMLDIIAVNQSGSVSVLLGKGDGTFQPPVLYAANQGGNAYSVAIGDLNGDANPDIVVSGSEGISVLLGNGDGTFQNPLTYSSGVPQGGWASWVVIADFNNDGKPDVATANYPSNIVGVLLGNGDGTMQPVVTSDTGAPLAWSVATADVNEDGVRDLIVGNFYGPIGVLLGNGDGTFQKPFTYSQSPGTGDAIGLVAVDVNGDGRPDIVLANGDNSVSVLLNSKFLVTSTTLTSSMNPSTYGQPVTFRAAVTSHGTPTGSVIFRWGTGNSLGSAVLNNGVATLTENILNADPYAVTAVYKGDSNNLGSTSTVLNQVVLQAVSSATLASSANPSRFGQAVTFTAKITSPTVIPTGPVTFTAGKTVLGTGQLSGGKATLTISSLAVGSTTVTATYYGDSNIAKSSTSVTQTVH
jgi:Bacterial Ig-like domain (group 3)/FG-GAP-like repeat